MTATARCRHFRLCGGCTQLTTPVEAQTATHDAALRERLQALPGFPRDVPIETVAAVPPALHWRTKLLYPAAADRDGAVVLGLYQRDSHRIVRIHECAIQHRALTEYARRVEAVVRAHALRPHVDGDERTQPRDGFRAFHARIAPATGELLAAVVRSSPEPLAANVVDALVAAANDLPADGAVVTRLVGLAEIENRSPGNVLLRGDVASRFGALHQHDVVDGLALRFHLTSFRQAHRDAAAQLLATVRRFSGDPRGMRVVDGYGGVGVFALGLARDGADVTLVESHGTAVDDARANALRNGLALTVVAQPFAVAAFAPRPDLLIVDPPRAGLGADGVARVLAAMPRRIVYVACGRDALLRDLVPLLATHRPTAVVRMDLFPHTDHDETVVVLDA